MKKTTKISKKLVDKEFARLSKKEKKALADANWAGKGEMRPPVVFASKRHEKTRPNIMMKYRAGAFD